LADLRPQARDLLHTLRTVDSQVCVCTLCMCVYTYAPLYLYLRMCM
jgi:hypothetical protein